MWHIFKCCASSLLQITAYDHVTLNKVKYSSKNRWNMQKHIETTVNRYINSKCEFLNNIEGNENNKCGYGNSGNEDLKQIKWKSYFVLEIGNQQFSNSAAHFIHTFVQKLSATSLLFKLISFYYVFCQFNPGVYKPPQMSRCHMTKLRHSHSLIPSTYHFASCNNRRRLLVITLKSAMWPTNQRFLPIFYIRINVDTWSSLFSYF